MTFTPRLLLLFDGGWYWRLWRDALLAIAIQTGPQSLFVAGLNWICGVWHCLTLEGGHSENDTLSILCRKDCWFIFFPLVKCSMAWCCKGFRSVPEVVWQHYSTSSITAKRPINVSKLSWMPCILIGRNLPDFILCIDSLSLISWKEHPHYISYILENWTSYFLPSFSQKLGYAELCILSIILTQHVSRRDKEQGQNMAAVNRLSSLKQRGVNSCT